LNDGRLFDVCVPRKYLAGGAEKTHFWQVGTGFGFENQTAKGPVRGVSVKLYTKLLVTDQLVLFEREREESSNEPPPDDNIPF
jgi:hypothetical protein